MLKLCVSLLGQQDLIMKRTHLPKIIQILIYSLLCVVLVSAFIVSAQQPDKTNITKNPNIENMTPEKFHIDELEVKQLNDFQARVQQRVNEVKRQGYGGALLLRPFSSTYRLYKYEVMGGLAVQDDIILGPLREIVRTSISNRDAGYKIGDPASKPIEGGILPPPLIPDAAFRWKNGVIPYEIDTSGFTNGHIGTIEKGIAALNNDTNLTLRERYNNEKDFVLISANKTIPGSGQSALGKQGDDQDLFLNTLYEKAFNERTVVHEMLHAAGFNHEQTRSDRDNYVRILWKNIEGDNAHNFEKDDSRTYGQYDVESIMHYYSTTFGKDCHISDYANNHFCKNCEIQGEADFIAAQGNNKSCSKHTIISKTATDISPSNSLTQKDIDAINAAYLRLLVDLTSGEIQHVRPQPATAAGGLVYYQRARQSGYSFFDSDKGEFQTVTFSGLEDGDATSYQMEAQIKLEGIVR
jgi:hypothetical protein